MTVDILSERGYHIIYSPVVEQIPDSIDLKTGKIHNIKKVQHSFQVKFKRAVIRRDNSVFEEVPPL